MLPVRPVPQLDYAGVVGFVLVLFLTVRSRQQALQRSDLTAGMHDVCRPCCHSAGADWLDVLQGWITVQCIIRSFPALDDGGLPTGGFGSTGTCAAVKMMIFQGNRSLLFFGFRLGKQCGV